MLEWGASGGLLKHTDSRASYHPRRVAFIDYNYYVSVKWSMQGICPPVLNTPLGVQRRREDCWFVSGTETEAEGC